MHVLGRTTGGGPTGWLGHYRARDGSRGDRVEVDLSRPHAAVVVGKRGSGKSHTLGVLSEELVAVDGVAPVVVDPMGAVGELPGGAVVAEPRVRADAVPPPAWCDLLGLDPAGAVGTLVWRAAAEASTLRGMREDVADGNAATATVRGATNHLRLAASWGVFDPGGLDPASLADRATVLDLSGLDRAPAHAVVGAVADGLYGARTRGTCDSLPWLLVDEAHAFVGADRRRAVAAPAIRRVLARGRAPGVSLVLATQRPAALPDVAVSQADLLVAHRLTGAADRERLVSARPSYLTEVPAERLPTRPGEAVVVDDATERVHPVLVRERRGTHGGASPRVATGQSTRGS